MRILTKTISIVTIFVFLCSQALWAQPADAYKLRPLAMSERTPRQVTAPTFITDPAVTASRIEQFNAFENAEHFVADQGNCDIWYPASGGLINSTVILQNRSSGRKYVVQMINTKIFKAAAIDNNLFLIEASQAKIRAAKQRGGKIGDIFPGYWRDVHYLEARINPGELPIRTKLHRDSEGNTWRVMEVIDFDPAKGEGVYNATEDMAAGDRDSAAISQGEAMAIFAKMVSVLTPKDITDLGLKPWQDSLTGFHVHEYHVNLLFNVAEGTHSFYLSLSNGADLTPFPLNADPNADGIKLAHRERTVLIQRNNDLIRSYPDGEARVESLMKDFEDRKARMLGLIGELKKTGQAITHGDTKLNNFMYFRLSDGRLVAGCLIDLDTVQPGFILDDPGDCLRVAGVPAGEYPKNSVGQRDLNLITIDQGGVVTRAVAYLKKMNEFYKDDPLREEIMSKLTEHIIDSFAVYLYAQAARFATDAVSGSGKNYFGIDPSLPADTNLFKAEVQMRSLKELEKVEASLKARIKAAVNPAPSESGVQEAQETAQTIAVAHDLFKMVETHLESIRRDLSLMKRMSGQPQDQPTLSSMRQKAGDISRNARTIITLLRTQKKATPRENPKGLALMHSLMSRDMPPYEILHPAFIIARNATDIEKQVEGVSVLTHCAEMESQVKHLRNVVVLLSRMNKVIVTQCRGGVDCVDLVASARRVALVVEDDPSVKQMLRMILRTEGYELQEYGSAADGNRFMESHPVDVVITDLGLEDSETGGLEVLNEANRLGKPVVMISGSYIEPQHNREGGFSDRGGIEGDEITKRVEGCLDPSAHPENHLGMGQLFAKPFGMARFISVLNRLTLEAPAPGPAAPHRELGEVLAAI